MASRGVKVGREDYGVSVAVYGWKDTMKALRSMAPDIAKQFDREIRDTIKPLQASARAKVPARPMRNWDASGPGAWSVLADRKDNSTASGKGWDAAYVRRKMTIKASGRGRRKRGVTVGYRLTNESAAGAIYELAGSGSSGTTPQSRAFIANTYKGGRPSRLIWQAWDEMGGEQTITPKVVEIMDRASATAQALINAANDKG